MGFTHRMQHDTKAMFTIAYGPIALCDIRDHLFRERYENGLTYAELIDARNATPVFLDGEVGEIGSLLKVFAKEHALGPTAVVVGRDPDFGVIRKLEHLVEGVCAIRAFYDVDAALTWLRETRLTGPLCGKFDATAGACATFDDIAVT